MGRFELLIDGSGKSYYRWKGLAKAMVEDKKYLPTSKARASQGFIEIGAALEAIVSLGSGEPSRMPGEGE